MANFSSFAKGTDPFAPRLKNRNVFEQTQEQSYRLLPCNEQQCFAIDTHLFYRPQPVNTPLYFHGGYWVDSFFEFNPSEKLSFNARVAAFHPAASYGVIRTSEIIPFVSVTWEENLSRYHLGNIYAKVQWLDLDKQTLGAGLSFEEKEMAGLILELDTPLARLRLVLDGTGGYMVARDLWYLQLDWLKEGLGVYIYSLDPIFPSDNAIGVFSKLPLGDSFSFETELSSRKSALAGLSRFRMNHLFESFSIDASIQGRYYGNGFAEDIVGQIEHDWVPIEHEERSYLISENIFSFDDNVLALGARLKVIYQFSKLLRLGLDLEPVHLNFEERTDLSEVFYKGSLYFCPSEHGCGSFFLSNRALNAAFTPTENGPLLVNDKHFGIDARLSF